MKKYEKEILQDRLDSEEKLLKELEKVFEKAAKDCADKIAALSARTDLENLQSIIYQEQYQKALKAEIDGILSLLHSQEFKSISEYLTVCYQNGFIGTMYSLHKQGIPLIFPIDQKAVVQAVQLDSKISTGLYMHLGESVSEMKKNIRAEVSRGVASNQSYNQIAQNIAKGMNTPFTKALFYATRIARTEGGRIANTSAMDACYKARDMGVDAKKQWDATLDHDTRRSHRKVDGEVRELDEPFSNGLMFPCDPSGAAAEVINCRCALLQTSKWDLDEEELEHLKERAAYFGLDKTEYFEEFKQKYLQASDSVEWFEMVNYKGAADVKTIKSLENSLAKMPVSHRTLAETVIDTIEIDDNPIQSGYSAKLKKIIYTTASNDPDVIIHEYAHALAYAKGIENDKKFISIRAKGLENLTIADVIYDTENFAKEIYRVESDKFISMYQGRLYEEQGFYSGQGLDFSAMLDYFSEGYKEYIVNPENLKKHDPDLFDYIEGIV